MPTNVDLTALGSSGFNIYGRQGVNVEYVGLSLASAGDVNGDGIEDLIVSAPTTSVAWVVFGKASGSWSDLHLYDLTPSEGFRIGQADVGNVSSAGDINNDGYDDVIVATKAFAGRTSVIFGHSGTFGTVESGQSVLKTSAMSGADGFRIDNGGVSVSYAGDVNNDGIDDILVSRRTILDSSYADKAYVIYGKSGGFGTIDLDSLAATDGFAIHAPTAISKVGDSLSNAGDVNGDGIDDFVVGSLSLGAHVIFGKTGGYTDIDVTTLAPTDGFAIVGSDYAGRVVAGGGDFNGDGLADLLVVGNSNVSSTGGSGLSAFVVYGKADGSAVDLAHLTPSQGLEITGLWLQDVDNIGGIQFFFTSEENLAFAGDVNGDGFGDIVIGSPRGGSAYVIYGQPSGIGTIDLASLPSALGFSMSGYGQFALTGFSVAAAGDVNHDGFDDVLVGTPTQNNSRGVAQVIYGHAAAGAIVGTPNFDALVGTAGDDFMVALAGDDTINGGAGRDRMEGGEGNDTYYVDNTGDLTIEAVGQGHDLVVTNTTYMLVSGQEVEELRTYGSATTTAIDLTGNEFGQLIVGNSARNVINGMAGADTMWGYGGNDTYYVDSANDRVYEAAGGGYDNIITNTSYTLIGGQAIEELTTYGSSFGGALDLTGNEYNQLIVGNDSRNKINGMAGADTMWGYGGDDTYYVDNAGDRVIESGGSGYDNVITSVSYALELGQAIEELTTYGSSFGGAIDLTGNEYGQLIVGNDSRNVINGGGGVDNMWGYGGNDSYYVDNAGDKVTEAVGGGYDNIITNTSYTLAAGQEIEELTTYGSATAIVLDLTGNEFGQLIVGNDAANTINGMGGADNMWGYGGNDTYFVDNAGDRVTEAAGGGNDTVIANVSYTLGAGQEIEALRTYGSATTAAINLTGNEIANTIEGNNGQNVLDGKAGSDTLYGYGGSDTFTFSTALGATNVDYIGDFQSGTDKVALDHAIFSGLATGALNANAFVIGTAALDADDRILYDAGTGKIYYDADGNGAGAAVLFATLAHGTGVTAADFVVF